MSKLLILFSFYLFLWPDPNLDTGKITIKVEGLKENTGRVGVMIFNQADGFPTEKGKAFLSKEVAVNGDKLILEFPDLPMGKYAVALIHDVNGNRSLDKNFMGIPLEPFGFSGNKSIYFGLPNFNEAAIELSSKEVERSIKLINLF